jgi:hypothetical protein
MDILILIILITVGVYLNFWWPLVLYFFIPVFVLVVACIILFLVR